MATNVTTIPELREHIDHAFDEVHEILKQHSADITTLKTDVGTLKTDVGALKTDVGALKKEVKAISNTHDKLSETIDIMHGQLDVAVPLLVGIVVVVLGNFAISLRKR